MSQKGEKKRQKRERTDIFKIILIYYLKLLLSSLCYKLLNSISFYYYQNN